VQLATGCDCAVHCKAYPYFSTSGIGDFVFTVNTEGAPDKNHTAMKASKIMHPNEDVGMKGQIGLPHKW